MIIDHYGRKHNYLRISLTERCNLRCTYCMPEEGVDLLPKEHLMTADEIIQLAKLFVSLGVNKIRLTGGEPLVRKDAASIIQRLSALPIQLNITTNGILVHQYIETFKAAGMQQINVSLDTLDADKFLLLTKRDHFAKVWENIHLLLQEGFRVKLNVVLMRAVNATEILDFVALTEQLPLQIQFIEFMPFDGNNWDWKAGLAEAEVLEQIRQYYGTEAVLGLEGQVNDTAVHYKIKDHQGSFGMISTVTNPFCDTCNRIRLTANGRIKNCLFSISEIDLLTALRTGQDVEALIHAALAEKAKARGGAQNFEDFSDQTLHEQNRSMIRIGG